ncbi:heat shock 70 kDa protein 12B-like [Mytilus galloprovincialis]|uniref:heat shock 70 kDa protein 12B-like n=1 Tax=Mytilus galloprovincialis TaxID=29158 RepID=UPI003F7CC18F
MESESAKGVTIDGDKDNEQTSPQNNYLFVAAIDFGTSYSGYAWSSRNDYKNYLEGKEAEPKIYANQPWNSGGKGFFSEKTPTCLLIDADRKLVAFGYDAENKYADLSQEGKHSDYYFFQRFKMNLHEGFQIETIDRILRSVFLKELLPFANHGSTDFSFKSKEMMATEMNGKQLPAFEVFAMSIKALVDHLMTMFPNKGNTASLKVDDIKWILTVPAIWSEKSKQFMRRSAVKAGIPNNNLSIALEPECASVYCQHLSTDHLYGARNEYSMKETGQKYVVVDLGGGTADIAVHEKIEGNKLKEIHRSTGSNCGGTSVDAAFLQFMDTTFGKPVLETMKKQYPESYLDLMREFESKKRTVKCDETDTIRMSLPMAALSKLCSQIHDKSIEDVILSSRHTEKVSVKTDKLRIKSEIFVEFFYANNKKKSLAYSIT